MSITLQEALQIAEKNKYADKLISIREYHDRYVMSYAYSDKDILCESPIYVMKDTGKVGVFFPPDYSEEYYNSGINIPIPQE